MSRYDVIVIGAGHNSLTAACYLAKAGKRVLVLEKRALAGGLGAGTNFAPGFRSPGVLHDTRLVHRSVINELGLRNHGLVEREDHAPIFVPMASGRGYLHWHDPNKASDEQDVIGAADVAQYQSFRQFLSRVKPFVQQLFTAEPPDVQDLTFPGLWEIMKKAVTLRMLGKGDMMEMLRLGPMCAADWLGEWFTSEPLKAVLCGPGIYFSCMGPWSPSSNANVMLYEALAEKPIQGGGDGLNKALLKAAESLKIDIKLQASVEEVVVKDGAVTGVRVGGESLATTHVMAGVDPKTLFLDLVQPMWLDLRFEQRLVNYRMRGTTAKVNLGIKGDIEWSCRPGIRPEYVRTGESVDGLEKTFDPSKYQTFGSDLALDVYIPSLEQDGFAPTGHHSLSILVHFVPYDLADGGWNESQRQKLGDTVIANLTRYAPGLAERVVAKEILTPREIEEEFGLSGGHLLHGEHAPDQLLVRPTLECARYQTPITGLYLCGSGSHPGGGLTCAPGALAARTFLRG